MKEAGAQLSRRFKVGQLEGAAGQRASAIWRLGDGLPEKSLAAQPRGTHPLCQRAKGAPTIRAVRLEELFSMGERSVFCIGEELCARHRRALGNGPLRLAPRLDTTSTRHHYSSASRFARKPAASPVGVTEDIKAGRLMLPGKSNDCSRLAQEVAAESNKSVPGIRGRSRHVPAKLFHTELSIGPIDGYVVAPRRQSTIPRRKLPLEKRGNLFN